MPAALPTMPSNEAAQRTTAMNLKTVLYRNYLPPSIL